MSGIKYNVTGQRTQINYGNGTGTSYEYDERNHRLKRFETRNAKSILQTIEYEYDDTGNVTERESEMLGTDGRMKHALHEYEYDSSGRLTEGSGKVEKTTAGILRPNIVSYKSKYSYDAIGNILTKTQGVNGGESSLSCNDTYTYGGKQPHAVTKAGAMVFTYDDNGNMIKRENTETKNTMTLVWDDENRLIKTTDSLHTTDYRYDANGERIIKKSELGETQYVSANYIVRNKAVISKHIFAGNQRVASTVSMKDNCGTVSEKNTMYFHPDHLGSSSYVTDKKGNFFEMIEYLPYGETLYDEAATVDKTEFRFTSHLKDDETGFYYCHARYYDPKIGKFISADDRFDDLYSSAGLNIFSYCHNNPINMVDPDGHAPIQDEKTRLAVSAELDMSQYDDLNKSRNPYVKDAKSLPADAKGLYDIDGGKVIATKYHSQRDNATSDPPVYGGNMCNLTALAITMEQMGIPQKYPGQQYEDELYGVAKSKGRGGSGIWSHVTKTYRKILPEYTDKEVQDIEMGNATANIKAIKKIIDQGIPVIVGGWTTPQGHVMTIVGYNRNGFILHDPNGDRNTNYSNPNGAYVNYGYGQWRIGSTWQVYIK